MPAGMDTSSVFFLRTYPFPRQSGQGSLTILPLPPQASQVRTDCITPKGVRWLTRTCPLPPQAEQVSGLVPFFAPLPPQDAQLSTRS